MTWFYIIIGLAIVWQLLFVLHMVNNYRYAMNKYARVRGYRPRSAIIVPCKGLDLEFERNITSFFEQDYDNYRLCFVVEGKEDPAYGKLIELKQRYEGQTQADIVDVCVAGYGRECSQKIHNLLYCYRHLRDEVEVLAFADSDACVRQDWLSHIVWPLRHEKIGVASGYRWFVPERNNLATVALSALNAKVAQLLGNSRFNEPWGGSCAIRVETFRQLQMEQIWPRALSDDLSLSRAVKGAGLKVDFVPGCLVASHLRTTWRGIMEFGRRQFIITRVYSPLTWWLGLVLSMVTLAGLWGGAAAAVYSAVTGWEYLPFVAAVPVMFFAGQLLRAVLRQVAAGKLLENERQRLRVAKWADILFFWVWSLLLGVIIISSAFGRTITWRGIKYRLISPEETQIVSRD